MMPLGAALDMAASIAGRVLEPEQRLLLCCCRLATDSAASAEIHALLDGGIDWDKLIELAVIHHVAPLVHRTIDRVASDRVPAAVAYAFRINYQGWQERTRDLWDELRRVLDGLADGGIQAIPFKGPVLAHAIYQDMALRPFGDLDFLLRRDDIDRALSLLETMRYDRPDSLSPKQDQRLRLYSGQYRLPRDDAEIWIEPHWALSQFNFAIDLDDTGLWERATVIDIDGYSARCFAPRDELLVLCVHGYREQWRRLKWICDIAEILRADPEIDWHALMSEARAVGCLRILMLGVILAHDLLGAPVPDRVLSQRTMGLDKLIASVLVVLFEERAVAPAVWRPNGFYFGGRERVRDKVRYGMRTIFLPRPAIIEAFRLPDYLFWLYYPVRWINDYVLLPPWLAWKDFTRVRHGSE
jgi:hypothetical protein